MARNYPPPPYPRMPRYRVQEHLAMPWREVSDEELRRFGEDPADYLPATPKPVAHGFFVRLLRRLCLSPATPVSPAPAVPARG